MTKMIDLHLHTNVSDGTDTPVELLENVKKAGIELFAITDHDDVKGNLMVSRVLTDFDPKFIPGAEFSCKDSEGKYHILGYGFDPNDAAIQNVVQTGHDYRMKKVHARLDFLKNEFGFDFPQEELDTLLSMDNPGKPHIGNLMVKYGYAPSTEVAIHDFIDKIHFKSAYVKPEFAISGILAAGGVPVLAHPSYGSGDQLIIGDEMDERVRRLLEYGLAGLEAFYSGFSAKLRNEILSLADKYDLYVTAGSDYHGKNKMVILGDTGLSDTSILPKGMVKFLKNMKVYED